MHTHTSSTVQNSTPQKFDVFLSYNGDEISAVARIADLLKSEGLEPWFDHWYTVGGDKFQEKIPEALNASLACAVFIGPHGFGNWEREELQVAQNRAAKDSNFRLFLVLLPGVPRPFDPSTSAPFLGARKWVDLSDGFDDKRALFPLICAIRGTAPGPRTNSFYTTSATTRYPDVCPYLGLQSFSEKDAEFFFGRDGDIQRLVEKLKATRFLAVIGPSGVGKSSLVRAGLLPGLRTGAIPNSSRWLPHVFTPGARPLETLAAYLSNTTTASGVRELRENEEELRRDMRTLHRALRTSPSDEGYEGSTKEPKALFVIDQFEEVFTLCQDEAEREHFISNLLYAATIPSGLCVVVLTLRADFYHKCALYPDFSARLAAHQFLVSPMSLDGLRQAVEEPARRVGLRFEEGLVDEILDDIMHQPGALPLLEHALLELWRERKDGQLTLEAYRKTGGVKGAIATRAENIFKTFDETQQVVTRRIMLRLTQPGEGTEDTRRRASLNELITLSGKRETVEDVIKTLTDARLLMTSRDEQEGVLVDVSHEALIRGWPRLCQWIDEDREGLRLHRELTEATRGWLKSKKDKSFLLSGSRLSRIKDWSRGRASDLNEKEQNFISASVSHQRRIYVAATIAGVLLLLFSVTLLYSFVKRASENAERVHEVNIDAKRRQLEVEAKALWPSLPDKISQIDGWLESARQLSGELNSLKRRRSEIDGHVDAPRLEYLDELIANLNEFYDPKAGVHSQVTQLREAAVRVKEFEESENLRTTWNKAFAEIAASNTNNKYPEFSTTLIKYLVPVGQDPESKLFEFAHILTGKVPERGADGKLIIGADTGLIFVLIPAGAFKMGAQKTDPTAANYDPNAQENETPLHDVSLAAFLISKYEMTQGQWLRLTGANPSQNHPRKGFNLLHPVDTISWTESMEVLGPVGLGLPTEAQWEYAARAGSSDIRWLGKPLEMIKEIANVRESDKLQPVPIGTYSPNSYGLHDMVGNVWELCLDRFGHYNLPVAAGSGERLVIDSPFRTDKGGSYFDSAVLSRLTAHYQLKPDYKEYNMGVRPVLNIR
ncbi:MAG TPA: SUMF1/EgtB/PvdO family nonheme iron enzyme [Pyrinomonadaceae bacterium]|jgi:formylglycine-generating enzyme required for sulfatase activity